MGDWDEAKHPRAKDGKFGAGSVDGGKAMKKWAKRATSKDAEKLYNKLQGPTGGFTYRPSKSESGESPKDGFLVSRDPKEGHGHIIDAATKSVSDAAQEHAGADRAAVKAKEKAQMKARVLPQLKEWMKKTLPKIATKKDQYLGGYVDEGGNIHLDVSEHFKPNERERAVSEGKGRNQISIWDVKKGEEIKTGGTGRAP